MHMHTRKLLAAAVLPFLALASVSLFSGFSISAAAPPNADAAAPASPPLDTPVRSALLVDARTGRTLYAKNPDDPMQPASLAKIMVFDLVLEALERGEIQLEEKARVSEKAWRLALDSGVSRMFVEVGTEVAIRDLLFGLMVSSGNDAAVVLAEHLAGDEDLFVRQMNQKAQALGMTSTRFINSHGLEAEGQQTTAEDIALLSRHLVNAHPEGLEYTRTKEFKYNIERPQPNFNGLVFRDDRITGLKTGHLGSVGYHLAATAEDRPMSLIAVVMGAENEAERENEAYKLLNYGFHEFETIEPDWRSAVADTLPVYKGRAAQVRVGLDEPLLVTIPRGRAGDLEMTAVLPETPIVAPVEAGERIGRLDVSLDGQALAERALTAQEEVPRGGLWKVFWDSVRLWAGALF